MTKLQMLPAGQQILEESYPLARRFYARFLPAFVLLLVLILGLIAYTVWYSTQMLHLQKATHTAENIANDVARALPDQWQRLITGAPLSKNARQELSNAFADEQVEYRLIGLKVYDLDGRTLYAHKSGDIGRIEKGAALKAVIKSGTPSAVLHTEPDGNQVFELYVPLNRGGRLRAVFEMYEPISGSLMSSATGMLSTVLPTLFVLFAALVAMFIPVVSHAQSAITARTEAIVNMRKRLERLVSRDAVKILQDQGTENSRASDKREMTLFFSDVRGFTQYCEANGPEISIDTLNTLVDVQLDQIDKYGGDIDKIIGDAIFARFEGAEREQRAIDAAINIQKLLSSKGLPLPIGIGVYSGPVICGFLGHGERLDYTVIGDSVNTAARLCSAAEGGQVIADTQTIETASRQNFSVAEPVSLKGRSEPVLARKWQYQAPKEVG